MPGMRKARREGRSRSTSKPRARRPAGQEAGARGELEHKLDVRRITDGQLAAEPLEVEAGEVAGDEEREVIVDVDAERVDTDAPDGGGDVRPDLNAAAHEAAGTGAPDGGAPQPEPSTFGASELLGLVKLGRAIAVTMLARLQRIDSPEVEELKNYDPDSWALMQDFAPAAARYMPWMNAHADLIGCVCFFGIAGIDTSAAVKQLKQLKRRQEQERRAAEQPGAAAASSARSTVVLGGDVASPLG